MGNDYHAERTTFYPFDIQYQAFKEHGTRFYVTRHLRNFMYVRYAFPDLGQLNGDSVLTLAIGLVSSYFRIPTVL